MKIDINRINKRIRNIKALKITPITAKESESFTVAYALESKGTSAEGEFLTFEEASKKFKRLNGEILTRERYETDITEFIEVISQGQTYVKGAVDYAYEKGKRTIEGSQEFLPPEIYKELLKLSKRKFIDALQKAGETTSSERSKSEQYASQQTIITQYSNWYAKLIEEREKKKGNKK